MEIQSLTFEYRNPGENSANCDVMLKLYRNIRWPGKNQRSDKPNDIFWSSDPGDFTTADCALGKIIVECISFHFPSWPTDNLHDV